MARLIIHNGVQQGRAFHLKTGVNRIGRSVENHFQVPDPSVSTMHCELILSSDGIGVRDLGSTNGTWIDGEPIQEAPIRVGQTLQLGEISMTLQEEAPAGAGPAVVVPQVPVQQSPVSVALPDGTLACANHPEVPGSYRCTKCQEVLCDSCIRVVRRVAGDVMIFCSLCSGVCESLFPAPPPPPVEPPKKDLLHRLADTLRLTFKR